MTVGSTARQPGDRPDPTSEVVTRALAAPDESVAGRRLYLAIVWVSVSLGLAAHALESPASEVAPAVAVIVGLAVWLHLVHRIHQWTVEVSPGNYLTAVGGAALALSALLVIDSAYLVVLFGMFTLVFAFSRDDRLALIASGVVTLIWLTAWVGYGLPSGGLATPVLVWGTLNIIAQATSRISAQSAERRDLLEQLETTRSLLAVVERERGMLAERQRLAAEIHDTLAQGFTSIVLVAEATAGRLESLDSTTLGRNIDLIETTARDHLTSARRMVEDLRPPELDRATLPEALRELVDKHRFTSSTLVAEAGPDEPGRQTEVVFRLSGTPHPLGGSLDVALLRAAQEALNNALKHAGASAVVVSLDYDPDQADVLMAATVRLKVVDDGVGFSDGEGPRSVAGSSGGRGLELLRSRLADVGATLSVTSAPGTGTTVLVEVPMDETGMTRPDGGS